MSSSSSRSRLLDYLRYWFELVDFEVDVYLLVTLKPRLYNSLAPWRYLKWFVERGYHVVILRVKKDNVSNIVLNERRGLYLASTYSYWVSDDTFNRQGDLWIKDIVFKENLWEINHEIRISVF